ncbi:MAG TPA: YegP family protein [Thermoanaerobaculia bacterium]|jgi:uncharacterized protein YegP (UPF0339 family)|nr:YegP family protein [Thermoanaerobaculia bacterium]
MAAAFVLKSSGSKFHFNLRAGNNETILTSELYEKKDSALNGIESVRKNAPDDARYERKTASNGDPFFVLKSTNGQVIGKSEMYSSTSARDNGIQSVTKTAPSAPLDDKTE